MDVFAQKVVAWNCATSKDVELVMVPLRMATWQRRREGHPVERGQLIGHSDAGWVDWYNNRRLHSSLGYLTPEEFEQAHYAGLTREPQPA